MDAFRWALKPVLLQWLIKERGYDAALFLDNDLYFVSDFGCLLEELPGASVLLTPHWRSSRPDVDAVNFQWLFLGGVFNAGFIGATRRGLAALGWWAMACNFACTKDIASGFYDDQRYLDAMPVFFEDVRIVRHRGCNVADWNREECPRSVGPDGRVVIAGCWPLVFIHFTRSLYITIGGGGDSLLKPFLDEHVGAIRVYDSTFTAWERTGCLPPEPGATAAGGNGKEWREKVWRRAVGLVRKIRTRFRA